MNRWEVTHESADNEGNLNIMFANGWEPFAVTQVPDGEGGTYPADIWLRRLNITPPRITRMPTDRGLAW